MHSRDAAAGGQARPVPPAAPAGAAAAPAAASDLWAVEHLRTLPAPAGAVAYAGVVRLAGGRELHWQITRATQDLLAADWAPCAEALGALAHPVRLTLLKAVLDGCRSTKALQALPGLGTSGQLYHHLDKLGASGWLRPARRGEVELPAERVVPLLAVLAAVDAGVAS